VKNLFRSTIVRVAVLVILLFFVVSFISLRLQSNELSAKANGIEAEIEAAEARIEQLQAEIERPFDDEYVAEIARTELGYRYPQEIIFYSGDSN